jgi:hypothetical protein
MKKLLFMLLFVATMFSCQNSRTANPNGKVFATTDTDNRLVVIVTENPATFTVVTRQWYNVYHGCNSEVRYAFKVQELPIGTWKIRNAYRITNTLYDFIEEGITNPYPCTRVRNFSTCQSSMDTCHMVNLTTQVTPF